MKGKTKWFNSVGGFGFIIPEDGSQDVFFHHSQLQAKGKLREKLSANKGVPVEFTPDLGERGPFARNVMILEEPE